MCLRLCKSWWPAVCRSQPPGQYVVSEQDRPAGAVPEMPEPIPIVDLSRLSAGSADEFAKLQSAMENWSFFLVVGHRMEPSFLDGVMNVAREFFKLPIEERQKCSNVVNGEKVSMQGYGNNMVIAEDQVLDWGDKFNLLVEPESERILQPLANTTRFFQVPSF
ncbi:hypothetical protein ACQ4PT_072011 [Festuca glaucescens]